MKELNQRQAIIARRAARTMTYKCLLFRFVRSTCTMNLQDRIA